MPTKTEQGDLLQAMFGRNGDAPMPVVAPGHARRVLRLGHRGVAHRAQVHDAGHLPLGRLPRHRLRALAHPASGGPARHPVANHDRTRDLPALRARPRDLARPWAIPGTPGLEHRIGGLEKPDVTGNVNYEPENHDLMTKLRFEKMAGIANDIPDVRSARPSAATCWSSAGAAPTAPSAPPCSGSSARASPSSQAHLRHLNPFPRNLGEVLASVQEGAHPREQHGPAAAPDPRPVPRRCGRAEPGAGQAIHDHRGRGRRRLMLERGDRR